MQATPPPPPAPGARRGAPHFVGVVASQCSDALINCKVSLFNFIATSRSLCNGHGPARWYCLEWRWWVVPSCFCGWPLSFSPIYSLQSSSPSPTKQTQVLSLSLSLSHTHTHTHTHTHFHIDLLPLLGSIKCFTCINFDMDTS